MKNVLKNKSIVTSLDSTKGTIDYQHWIKERNAAQCIYLTMREIILNET